MEFYGINFKCEDVLIIKLFWGKGGLLLQHFHYLELMLPSRVFCLETIKGREYHKTGLCM